MAEIDELQDQIAALEATLAGSAGMVAAFDGELARMRDSLVFTGREVNTLSTGIGGGLRRAFDGLVFDDANRHQRTTRCQLHFLVQSPQRPGDRLKIKSA
ncbi:MAG: hypothetical protein ACKO56_03225 [Paracoccaceae bacterium]